MDAAKRFVAAIDIGTTYSGYAFSTKSHPNNIYMCEWKNSNLLSYKAPTSVLLDRNKEFLAFGYDAEIKYMSNLEIDSDDEDSGEEKDVLYFFRRFKLALKHESVDMDSLIKDESGTEMKAFDIFTFAFKYFKEQIINKMRRTLTDVDEADIHYVLTVPAIWNDNAKLFMRKSAEEAGIKGNQLTIALEAEAASLYCQELRSDREDKGNLMFSDTLKTGMKFVMLDLGGGTADVAIYQLQANGFLGEVLPPSGGAWGGIAIDDAFLRFLENVFGTGVMKDLKLTELEDYTELIHEFEVKKRLIKTDTTTDIVITMPYGLVNIIKKHCGGIDAAIKKSRYSDSISCSGQQKLFVNQQKFKDLFKPTIQSILKHLEQLFRHPKVSDIQHIIMVGGFSECELVQRAMKDEFPKKKIFIPEEAGIAVLKGAVIYGHQPKLIRSEIIESTKLFVVAIDFGTTYSGYAFSAKSSPNEIYTCEWQKRTFLSAKAPTSVLLDKEKKFMAFGYKAEAKYIECLERDASDSEDEDTVYNDVIHYFNRFKMMLHKKIVNLDTTIKDQNGEEVRALDIFSFAIKYLKERAEEKLSQSLKNVEANDIHYVLTVPAIWNDQAKLFMRKAAEKANIKGQDLTIALEPETASVYCQERQAYMYNLSETDEKGTKYLVLDLGGGTADITVHERRLDGSLGEVIPSSGEDWGGTAVDQAYIELLNCIFTEMVIEELKSDELEDYFELLFQFEVKKRSVTSDLSSDIVITLPLSLVKISEKHYKSVQSLIMQSSYKDSIYFTAPQKLFVSPEVFRKLFEPTIDALVSHLEKLIKDPKITDLQHIIMVGGFSECELVQTAMRQTFPNRKIIIPEEAGLAVLKGAVLFGHQPKKISKRVLKKTYGIQTWLEWDPELHPKSKRERIDGVYRCKDIFHKFAEIGEKVEEGHSHRQIFKVLNTGKRTIEHTVFISDEKNPRYVTDLSCQRLGNLIIPIPPLKKGETLEIEGTLMFGGTEILIRAKNLKTGEIFENQFELF